MLPFGTGDWSRPPTAIPAASLCLVLVVPLLWRCYRRVVSVPVPWAMAVLLL
ncbi:hypothetical protein KI387_007626, partial [Taxus chinensis]